MTATDITDSLEVALKQFGTYNYYDKGVDEIFNAHPIEEYLKTLSGKDAGKLMKEVAKHEHGQHLIDHLAEGLEDQPDAWFDAMLTESGANF